MNKKEKEIAARLAEAFKILPNEKKERWLGYAEGVADMAKRHQNSASSYKENKNERI